jgi:hypothetical protein
MFTYKNLTDCKNLGINMFFIVVYMVLGHPLHFPFVTFDKIQSKLLILPKFIPNF